MSVASQSRHSHPAAEPFDPDDVRMSVGEHLDELRGRLVKALLGVGAAFAICLVFGRSHVIPFFCRPLMDVLREGQVNPQMYFTGVTDPFMVYVKISLLCGVVLAGPWVLWQFWQFVAAGLYPHERRAVTKHVPLSIGLMVSGTLVVYFLVLPFGLDWFLGFGLGIPLPAAYAPDVAVVLPEVGASIPLLSGDPASVPEGRLWVNTLDGRLKMMFGGEVRVLPFGSENLMAPMITLPQYINLVLMMLVVFAGCFQLPLAILGLTTAGIVDVDEMTSRRRQVYFALTIVAALVTPADPFTLLMLAGPLVLLFELGVWLSRRNPRVRG